MERDKAMIIKNQSLIDSLKEQNRQLMANTSKEVQMQQEQHDVEKEKVQKLESQIEELKSQLDKAMAKIEGLSSENEKLKEETSESRRKRRSSKKATELEEQLKQEHMRIIAEKVRHCSPRFLIIACRTKRSKK